MLIKIVNYFLWFIMYSVFGWITETILFAVRDKKSVKRGFLFGPLCPIYGSGAVLCTILLYGKISNFFALFFVGLLLCDTLEYITHYVLEKVFHAMWWDYSNQRFNIKGRICLTSSILFGLGVALLIKFVQPFVMNITERIPEDIRLILAFVIYSILIIDLALTVQSLKNIIRSLKEIQNYLVENMQDEIDKTDEKIDEMADKIKSNAYIDNLVEKMKSGKSQLARYKRLFPKMNFGNYKEALEVIFPKNKNK